ncbi:hypothetical protein HAX54_016272 [Datura stramonium]|uniref:Uncharacterized protein n=1 Tax=Datura stramonium TaxID=4076 RepID=A0ABS8RZW9_DATST|nr:hypothetical protein [Datura stramonium]
MRADFTKDDDKETRMIAKRHLIAGSGEIHSRTDLHHSLVETLGRILNDRNQTGGSMVRQSNGTVTQTTGNIDSLKTDAKENKNWANLFQGSPMGSKDMDLELFSPIIKEGMREIRSKSAIKNQLSSYKDHGIAITNGFNILVVVGEQTQFELGQHNNQRGGEDDRPPSPPPP